MILLSLLLLLISSSHNVFATIVSQTETISDKGVIRYHYDDSLIDQCESVMLINVGTAMNVMNYDNLASDTVTESSTVFIMTDQNPGGIVKFDGTKYAELVETVVELIKNLVPACSSRPPPNGYIIGGHSAGGQAALEAISTLSEIDLLGYFGLDPFLATVTDDVPIPGLYWGFTTTTCAVNVNLAASYAYDVTSNPNKVFYQIINPDEEIKHCVFTDTGCGLACPCRNCQQYDSLRATIGNSANIFITAIVSGEDFDSSNFVLNNNEPINVFVGDPVTEQFAVNESSKFDKKEKNIKALKTKFYKKEKHSDSYSYKAFKNDKKNDSHSR